MFTEENGHEVARLWGAAWNDPDVDRVIEHCADATALASSAARLPGTSTGIMRHTAAPDAYIHKGFAAYPGPRSQLMYVMRGIDRVVRNDAS